MFKKITALLLLIISVFTLSSCGEKTDASSLKESEFISSETDEDTLLRYDEYADYV